jgi:SAM-dependent MidA family methyltransferase
VVQSIQFHEVYVPVGVVPEVKAHLQSYARMYALELASRGKGIVAYINLGEEKFIREAGRALNAGYVVTIDYGSTWDGIMKPGQPHLRTYGPGNQQSAPSDLLTGLALGHMEAGRGGSAPDPTAGWDSLADVGNLTHAGGRGNPDPYRSPSLNDVTTDVNFSYLAAEGVKAGLRTVYFGPQRALQTGTSISFNAKNAEPRTPNRERELGSWLSEFAKDSTFKVLIQQKQGTDDSYVYPDNHPQPLDADEGNLSAAQRRRAAEIEQEFRGGGK